MKGWIDAGVGLLALLVVAPAQAADMIVKAPPAPVWSWTGFYAGLNVGYGWGRSDTDFTFSDVVTGTALLTQSQNVNLDGWLGGVQIGYNWQAGRIVYGIEADIQATGQKGDALFTCPAATCASNVTATLEQKMPWLATLRGRLGVTASPVMFYVTGGLAVAEVETSGVITGLNVVPATVSTAYSSSTTKAGWTLGVGGEAVVSGRWTAKVEYLYVDLGNVSGGSFATTIAPPVRANFLGGAFDSRITDHIVRVGLNYHFR